MAFNPKDKFAAEYDRAFGDRPQSRATVLSVARYYNAERDGHSHGLRIVYPDGGMDQVLVHEDESKEGIATALMQLALRMHPALKDRLTATWAAEK